MTVTPPPSKIGCLSSSILNFLVFPACYLNVTWTEQKIKKKKFRGGAASRRQYGQSFSNFRGKNESRNKKKRQKYKRHGFLFKFLFLVLQFVCCFTSFLFYSPVFFKKIFDKLLNCQKRESGDPSWKRHHRTVTVQKTRPFNRFKSRNDIFAVCYLKKKGVSAGSP
jgi:hypothetical protein